MKQSLIFAFLLFCFSGHTQNCIVSSLGFDTTANVFWADGDLRNDGSMVGTLGFHINYGDILATEIEPNGEVDWMKVFSTVDPYVRLIPFSVQATENGGMLIFGARRESTNNFFALQLDAEGCEVWARIYMVAETYGSDYEEGSSIQQIPGGEYILTLSHDLGQTVSRLDATGYPIWSRTINAQSDLYSYAPAGPFLVEDNGDMVFTCRNYDRPTLFKTDQNGNVLWSRLYDPGHGSVYAISKTANGDYLVGTGEAQSQSCVLMKLDINGNFIWNRQYSASGSPEVVQELSNSDILMVRNRDLNSVVQLSPDGIPISSWSLDDDSQSFPHTLLGIRGDSLVLGTTELINDDLVPKLLIANNIQNISCGVDLGSASIVDSTSFIITHDSLFTYVDSIRTWTMAFKDCSETSELDLQVGLHSTGARPGFDITYFGGISNPSLQLGGPVDAVLQFDPLLVFNSASPGNYSIIGNEIHWSNLDPVGAFGVQSLSANFTVPADTALLGNTLLALLTATQDSVEVTLDNNSDPRSVLIVGSYDPNDKLVDPPVYYDPIDGTTIDYTIRFQNTGTASAINVVITDTLPEEVSVGSFQPGFASHEYTYDLNAQGIINFYFYNINLPDSNANEPESHGLVTFSVVPDDDLVIGQLISNSADIFFDFNPPVRTEPAEITYGQLVGIQTYERPEKLLAYPIPVKDVLVIEIPEFFKPEQLEVTSVQGVVVMQNSVRGLSGKAYLPTDQLAPGMYYATITDENGKRAGVSFLKE